MKFNKTESKLLARAAEWKTHFIAGATHLPVSVNDAGEFIVRVPVCGSRELDAANALQNAGLGTFEYDKFPFCNSRGVKFWGFFAVTFPNA